MYKKILLSLGFAAIILTGCSSNEEKLNKVLQAHGFDDTVIVDKSTWFLSFRGCNKSDYSFYKIKTTTSQNKVINIGICCPSYGSFKPCHITEIQ